MKENLRDVLMRALFKKAKGYLVREKTDEYVITEDSKKLVKSKVVTKRAPPDVAAARVLLELNTSDFDVTDMTDEQLNSEKLRLIKLLAECRDDEQ